MKVCCICGCNIPNVYGENNPRGAMWRDPDTNEIVEFQPEPEDVCCNECNTRYVIPGRMYKMKMSSSK